VLVGSLEIIVVLLLQVAGECSSTSSSQVEASQEIHSFLEVYAVAPYRIAQEPVAGDRYQRDEPWRTDDRIEARRGFRLPSSLALCRPFEPLAGRSSLSGVCSFESVPGASAPISFRESGGCHIPLRSTTTAQGNLSTATGPSSLMTSHTSGGVSTSPSWQREASAFYRGSSREVTPSTLSAGMTFGLSLAMTDPSEWLLVSSLIEQPGSRENRLGRVSIYRSSGVHENGNAVQSESALEWEAFQVLEEHSGLEDSFFGFAVAVDRDLAIVSAPGLNNVYVYVLDRPAAHWKLAAILHEPDGVLFGVAIGLWVGQSGDDARIVVADPAFQEDQGRVSVYSKKGDGWTQDSVLEDLEGQSGDMYGSAVSIHGDHILVGAPGSCKFGENRGLVYAYRLHEGSWRHDQTFVAPQTAAGTRFGMSLSMSATAAVIGSESAVVNARVSGSAWVYGCDEERGWTLEQQLTPSSPSVNGMKFGSSVAIRGDTMILVGCTKLDAWRLDSSRISHRQAGAAILFLFVDGYWHDAEIYLPPKDRAGDEVSFGAHLALSRTQAVVGTPWIEQKQVIGDSDLAIPPYQGAVFAFQTPRFLCSGGCRADDGLAFDRIPDAAPVLVECV